MMAFSWLQKRQVKVVARGSRYGSKGSALRMMKYGKGTGKIDGWIWRTFFGPCGLRDDFLRFPYERCQTMVICIDEEGMLLDAPWLQTAVVDKGGSTSEFVRSLLI